MVISSAADWSAASCEALNDTVDAATFSSTRSIRLVPGIGTIHGFWASNHASASWAEVGATPAQLALAWLLAQKPWIVPIPGTKRIERVEENVAASTVSLSASQLAAIQSAADEITIVGARYPEELDRMTNLDAPKA